MADPISSKDSEYSDSRLNIENKETTKKILPKLQRKWQKALCFSRKIERVRDVKAVFERHAHIDSKETALDF